MAERTTRVGGAKVTIGEAKPSAQLVKASEYMVTDAQGRSFTLKKPGVLSQFRLVEALGDTALNQVYMGMVLPLLFVLSIDGDAVVAPASKGEVEALIKRLDEDGIQAVMTGVQEHFTAADPEGNKKK